MSGSTCDVCGGGPTTVCNSACGATSFAYCDECLRAGAEPFGVLVSDFVIRDVLSRDRMSRADEVMLAATLKRSLKTEPEFWRLAAEVKRELDEMP